MAKSLKGKVALVTGGSRGIGAAIALALADEGADVVISYANSAAKAGNIVHELKSKGVRAQALKADQANEKEVEDLVKKVAQQFGRLDILVNNAGVFTTGAVQDGANNRAELERLFAVNVGGVVAAVRAASGVLSEGGRIISIGSIVGDTSPWPGVADYSATKAAVAAYTRGWARDLGLEGHHRQRRAAGTYRHRHEPCQQWRVRRSTEGGDGARPLRQAGGSGGSGRLLGQARSGIHHRHHAKCRWWLPRLDAGLRPSLLERMSIA